MFEIRATESAERDLQEIHNYLLGELFNPQAWTSLSEKIADAFHTLQDQPFAFCETGWLIDCHAALVGADVLGGPQSQDNETALMNYCGAPRTSPPTMLRYEVAVNQPTSFVNVSTRV